MNSDVKKRVKFKKGIFQRLFWVLSVLFLLIVVGYFGFRFIVISKIYGSNKMNVSDYIIKNNNEDTGLYLDNQLYIFKGATENNYLQYNNLLFRIVKVYQDGSVEIILDEGINSLHYNEKYSNYLKSDVHEYLNDIFLEVIDKGDLNKTPVCIDEVKSIDNITCNKVDYSSYVKLLMIGDYVNSLLDSKSYLGKEGEYYWLGNVTGDKIWNLDGEKLSQSDPLKGYKVRPVITLNEKVKYLEGNGTKEEPIVVKEREVGINSYVKIEDDLYVVIQKEKSYLKMMLMEDSPLVREIHNKDLLDNLNDKYYNNLSYKKKLVKFTLSTSEYDKGYKAIKDEKKTVYVGIPTISDFKFGNIDGDYLLVNRYDNEQVFYYDEDGLHLSEDNLARKIRPVIMIKKQEINGGNGTSGDPYIVEVK